MPYPITGDEVSAMFKAITRPPLPCGETCTHLATWLSSMMPARFGALSGELVGPEFIPASPDQLASLARDCRAASKLLTKIEKGLEGWYPVGSLPAAIAQIEVAAASLHWKAKPRRPPNAHQKGWSGWAVAIAITASDIFADLGRRGGLSRNSPGVKFAALALERIGWRDANNRAVTPGAIERYCSGINNKVE